MKVAIGMIVILFQFFGTKKVSAQVLLVPDPEISFEVYKGNCSKEGYICTPQYQLDLLQKSDSVALNEWLNQLDYSSPEFKKTFLNKFFSLLKEEDLSVDQAEILLKMLEQLKQFDEPSKIKQLTLIEDQLTELIRTVKANELTELPAQFLVVFKKALPLSLAPKLKPLLFQVKVHQLAFNRVLNKDLGYFVRGRCETASLHPQLTAVKWQIDSAAPCGFSQQFTRAQESTFHFIKENKGTLITAGLVVVGAALLLNNYEVQFNF